MTCLQLIIKHASSLGILYEVLFYLCNEKHKCRFLNFAYNRRGKCKENVTEVSMKENKYLQSFDYLENYATPGHFMGSFTYSKMIVLQIYLFFFFQLLNNIFRAFLERQMHNTYVKLLQYYYSRSAKSAFPYGNTNFWPICLELRSICSFIMFFLPLVPGYDLIRVYHVKSDISEC